MEASYTLIKEAGEKNNWNRGGKSESLVMKQIRFLPVENNDLICCYF